jgi:AcrR family transcriptional regulator
MGRWQPDSRGRLAEAALVLYAERGFESTTVAEIAARAGVTERTFFRHFADKREVLFAGAGALEEAIVCAVAEAPADATALDAVAAGLDALGAVLPDDPARARHRQAIIAANAELRERELYKLSSLSATLAEALRDRRVGDPAATLAGEIGIAVFKTAFERWIDEGDDRPFAEHVREATAELKTLAGAG